jgi:hypothetical protein
LVLSPTGSINLGFTTEGKLAVVLIITFSWGFQLGGYTYIITTSTPHHQQIFWRRCRGLKKKKLPRQLHASKIAISGERLLQVKPSDNRGSTIIGLRFTRE